MLFGKYKGQPLSAVPKDYADWLCKQDGFQEKNSELYNFFTLGEEESSTPVEREVLDLEKQVLLSVEKAFTDWWSSAYGERLRKQGENFYIPYLRVAIAAWSAAQAHCATTILKTPPSANPKNESPDPSTYDF